MSNQGVGLAGSLDESFYMDNEVKQQFQQHIRALLNHRNVYSEVAYLDTPAIFACALSSNLYLAPSPRSLCAQNSSYGGVRVM